ncbi:MAG: hypothetical protein ACI85K_001716 [Hyphomicrobiaceae bacterium]|jgi:hypothetical protein
MKLGSELLLMACACVLVQPAFAQNSNKKIRKAPSEMAAKAGTAVPWRTDVATALAESKKTGKPVFWYVPSVSRSPMDRKPEIDRYMMGGPFSWSSTIELLTEHFVPVKQTGGKDELSKQLQLARNKFIEPGYVVLDGDGKALLKVDQLTTFQPEWFEAPLRRIVKQPTERWLCDAAFADAWSKYRLGDYLSALPAAHAQIVSASMDQEFAEGLWLEGACQFRLGARSEAVRLWKLLIKRWPNSPLAWKAALEVEGHGPFVHGFEVYGTLPATVLKSDPVDGTRSLVGVYQEQELWRRSVAFLAGAHDDDGVYRDSTYDFGGTDGLPNVHAAVTCLVGEALLAAMSRADKGDLKLTEAQVTRVETLLLQMRANAISDDWLALSDRDEIIWARAYALRFLQAWKTRRGKDADAIEPGVRRGVAALIALQPETGAWFHEYGNPFAIATALQALHGAKSQGFEVPQENIDKGLKALAFNRAGDGAFSYGQTRPGRKPRAKLEGAAGRMPLCELGLYLFGASSQERLLAAVEAGDRHHKLLAAVRKYDDHADRLGYGGFFFWFDMLGRAEAIAELTDSSKRKQLAAAQHKLIMELPEFDGCFVDSHELGRCYGTAMALLCFDVLARAQR